MAGVKAYTNDPTRKPEFTKYPASWLNADAWENTTASPELRAIAEERMARERAATEAYFWYLQACIAKFSVFQPRASIRFYLVPVVRVKRNHSHRETRILFFFCLSCEL